MIKRLVFSFVIWFVAAAGQAQTAGEFSIATGASILGGNVEIGYRTTDHWRLRGVAMGAFYYEDRQEEADFTTTISADLGGYALMADYYPRATGWRISAGLLDFESRGRMVAVGDLEFSGTTFPDARASVTAVFANELSPIITTGYDMFSLGGLRLNSELGVILTGGVELTAASPDPNVRNAIETDPDYLEAVEFGENLMAVPYASLTVSFSF